VAGSGPCASTPVWVMPRSPNKRYKYLLANGTTGLSVAFDSAHPDWAGFRQSAGRWEKWARWALQLISIEDMQRLFDGINLTEISTSMTINATASILLALYIAVGKRQGRDVRKLSGTIQNDVAEEYIARGTYIYPPQQAMRIITDIFAWTKQQPARVEHDFHLRLSHARSGIHRCAGSCVHLGNGIAYVGSGHPSRARCRQVCSALELFSSTRTVIFWKKWRQFRAAAECGRRSCANHFQAKESEVVDAALPHPDGRFDAYRAAAGKQYCADGNPGDGAVLGGTQSLHTNSFDEALACPPSSRRALPCAPSRLLRFESGAPQTVDPLAGSLLHRIAYQRD